MERTLLLSTGYEPITTISWQRAISLLTLGKVEVVETYDREVRSMSLALKLPSVVRLVNLFRRHKQRVKYSKQNVFARDRWACQYCGTKHDICDLTVDHVVPRAQGGKTEWENVVTACKPCNSTKADRTPQQAGLRLRKKPEKPDWVPLLTLKVSRERAPQVWQGYLKATC